MFEFFDLLRPYLLRPSGPKISIMLGNEVESANSVSQSMGLKAIEMVHNKPILSKINIVKRKL